MPVQHLRHYTRFLIHSTPDALFVFGDNLARKGFGGQAAEARGEPNAVGLPTKRFPSNSPEAFLTDADLNEVRAAALPALNRLKAHLLNSGTVYWPEAGIGTGLARLADMAPEIFEYYREWHEQLQRL